jgi:hypothetical protein
MELAPATVHPASPSAGTGRQRARAVTPQPRLARLAWRLRHVAHDRLPTIVDRHILHRELLLATRAVALERLHLACKRPGELVEGALRAVLSASRRANAIVARCTAAICAASTRAITSVSQNQPSFSLASTTSDVVSRLKNSGRRNTRVKSLPMRGYLAINGR